VVDNLITVLLEIYCSLLQWKNFANPPRIDKAIVMVMVAPFFDSRCISISTANFHIFFVWTKRFNVYHFNSTCWLTSTNKLYSANDIDNILLNCTSSSKLIQSFPTHKTLHVETSARFPHFQFKRFVHYYADITKTKDKNNMQCFQFLLPTMH